MATTDPSNLSSKEMILNYLIEKKGQKVELRKVREDLGLKKSTLSNAIKELRLLEKIELERDNNSKGRPTRIWLKGSIEQPIHEGPTIKDASQLVPIYNIDSPAEMIDFLRSSRYNFIAMTDWLEKNFKDKIDLAINFFLPVLQATGRFWYNEKITSADEHAISSRLEALMYHFSELLSSPNQDIIVLAPVEGDQHYLSLVLLEMIVSPKFHCINLKKPLSVQDLVEFIRNLDQVPKYLLVNTTMNIFHGTLIREVTILRRVFKDELKIVVAGAGLERMDLTPLIDADRFLVTQGDWLNFVKDLIN